MTFRTVLAACVAAISACLALCSNAEAQVAFSKDSIFIHYVSCIGQASFDTVVIRNLASTPVSVDLGFADEDRTWYFVYAGEDLVFKKGIMIAANDSLVLEVDHSGSSNTRQFIDSMVVSSATSSDTLFLTAESWRPTLTQSADRHDFGVLLTGESKTIEITVTNTSIAPWRATKITSPSVWKLTNLEAGDTILPGETRTLLFTFVGQSMTGYFSTNLYVESSCTYLEFRLSAKVVPPGISWEMPSIQDTIRGCLHASDYEIKVMNRSSEAIALDSIGFVNGGAKLWTKTSTNDLGSIIQPGSSITAMLHREPLGRGAPIVTYPSIGKPDTIPLYIAFQTARPILKNAPDTLRFDRKIGETIPYAATLQNEGEVSYRITSVDVVGSELWSIVTADTVTQLGKNRTTDIQALFAGATTPGEYTMTYSVRGTPCDEPVSQTLIARVGMAAVEAEVPSTLDISIDASRQFLTVNSEQPFDYSIFDVLGHELLSGSTVFGSHTIDISPLPRGAYFIRLSSSPSEVTRAFNR